MKSVLVIGAGIGGITTAARLAQNGYDVTVIEKCEQAGGRCGQMVSGGHKFDTGATLFLLPELYVQTFKDLGERMEDYLDLIRVDPSYKLHFEDNSTLQLSSDLETMQSQLESIEPGSFGNFLRYLQEGNQHYELSLRHLVRQDFRNPQDFFNLKNLLLVIRLKALIKHYDNVGKYFKDPRLKIAFTFQNMYVGLSPYDAPALFSLLQYSEFAHGVWFPKGGMYTVIDALKTIAERLGVKFIYNAEVSQININCRRTSGVTLADNRRLPADIVVANADLPYVYSNLLSNNGADKQFNNKKYSCSAIMFCWGMDKRFPMFRPHNLFFGGDYRKSFDDIFNDCSMPDMPSFYLHAPVGIDPSFALSGQDSITAVIPVGHIDETKNQDWTQIQGRARQTVFSRLAEIGLCDFEEHIKFEESFLPPHWQQRFNLMKGSTHGLSHDIMQMGYFRPKIQHNKYRNLYFVGASTHPGIGLPTVLVSAGLVTQRILDDQKADNH